MLWPLVFVFQFDPIGGTHDLGNTHLVDVAGKVIATEFEFAGCVEIEGRGRTSGGEDAIHIDQRSAQLIGVLHMLPLLDPRAALGRHGWAIERAHLKGVRAFRREIHLLLLRAPSPGHDVAIEHLRLDPDGGGIGLGFLRIRVDHLAAAERLARGHMQAFADDARARGGALVGERRRAGFILHGLVKMQDTQETVVRGENRGTA